MLELRFRSIVIVADGNIAVEVNVWVCIMPWTRTFSAGQAIGGLGEGRYSVESYHPRRTVAKVT